MNIKRLLVAAGVASTLAIGGVALATQTGNDNGHGDHGCHVGEKNNDEIINPHCPSPSPSASGSHSPSPSPSVSVSPSPTPSGTATPSPSVSPQLSTVKVLPDTGGHGVK